MLAVSCIHNLAAILFQCKKDRNRALALRLYAVACGLGLQAHTCLGNYFVPLLVEVGKAGHAQQVMDFLPCCDLRTWNCLIVDYAKQGKLHLAFDLYKRMLECDSLYPNAVTYMALIKACTKLKDLGRGHKLHVDITKRNDFQKNVFIGGALVDMYAKCGSLHKARQVFDGAVNRDAVLWNTVMTGYTEHCEPEESLKLFEQMQNEYVFPDQGTYVCVLKACSDTRHKIQGYEMHVEIVKRGLENDNLIGNTLVNMYGKCGSLLEEQNVFDNLMLQDMVAWTSLISGYADYGNYSDVLLCLEQMQQEDVCPDTVMYIFGLKACGFIETILIGKQIHARIARNGAFQNEFALGSALLDMYAKCGSVTEAENVFYELPARDVISWNSMLTGYVEHGYNNETLNLYDDIEIEGISPDIVSFLCTLKASSGLRMLHKGHIKHYQIITKGFESEIIVVNSLIDMYAKCCSLQEAEAVFEKLHVRSIDSWTTLINGYVDLDCFDEALYLLEKMENEGVAPSSVTFLSCLKACGSAGVIIKGQKLHCDIVRKGLEMEEMIGNTLVDMYAKCGMVLDAQKCFDNIKVHTMVSWSALIGGYSQLGDSQNAFQIFDKMVHECVCPNFVTYLSLFRACSHTGMLRKGLMCFDVFKNDKHFIPTLEHYACMVDLLGRSGCVGSAIAIIRNMPYHPGTHVWHTLLGACQRWCEIELGQYAFEHVVEIDQNDVSAYVGMSNIYADAMV